jgi:hypothetical protein
MGDVPVLSGADGSSAPHGDGFADDLRTRPLDEWMAGLPDETVLGGLGLGTRMSTVLGREGLTTYEQIRAMSVVDLLALRGAGVGSVRDLLERLQTFADVSDTADRRIGREQAWRRQTLVDLETLARWHRILGSEGISVLVAPDAVAEPAAVTAARTRITALSASTVLPDVEEGGAAAAAVEAVLEGLNDREIAVLRDRVMADTPVSLDDLGKRYEVSRERIRQIETRLLARLTDRTREGDLLSLATIVADGIGSLVPLRALVQRHPTLGEHVPSIDQPVWRFLDRLDDAYEIKDGWCARGTLADAVARTRSELVRLAGERAFVELAAVDDDLELSEGWLEYCGVTLLHGCALPGRAGMLDRAEVVLHTRQEQMTADELVAAVGVERSVRSLRNQLSEDPRFSRVDREEWALAAWGLTGYLPIRAMIGRSLDAAGGEMTLDDLIGDIATRFDVSPRSIVTFATSFPYITTKGVVRRRRRRDMRRPRRKGLAQTRALYRHDDGVRLRVVVNSEHLRGSGSALPAALGEEIDLSIGEAKTLVRREAEGTIHVSWRGPQIILGSVRAEFEKRGLVEGDVAFLVFGTDGTFGVEPLSHGGGPESQILALTGSAAPDDDGVWATLADRIDATADDRDAVVAALTARGDAPVLELAGALRVEES